MAFNFNMEEKNLVPFFEEEENNLVYTTACDVPATSTTVTVAAVMQETFSPDSRSFGAVGSIFSPLAPTFQSRAGNERVQYLAQQEPRIGDVAPSTADITDETLLNLRINGPDMVIGEVDESTNSFFMGGSECGASNLWGEGSTTSVSAATRHAEMMRTFDFFIKSLTSANSFVSTLTADQLSVLRSIRPELLYEFLQDVARVRNDKRLRRAGPNECAFCKNNGENEDSYTSHALKDSRGRVLCPVLRAFRCPRCGATGDRAHTIKYCPENDNGFERSGNFSFRRRATSTSFIFGGSSSSSSHSSGSGQFGQVNGSGQFGQVSNGALFGQGSGSTPPTPSPSPSTSSMSHSGLWNPFNRNQMS